MTHLRKLMLDELQRRNYAKTTVQYYFLGRLRAINGFHVAVVEKRFVAN